MRKEDKVLLPPRRKFRLPEGFHVERAPREYHLFFAYPVVDEEHHPHGTMTDLVAVFPADRWGKIEPYARDRQEKLKKRLEHEHPEGEDQGPSEQGEEDD